MFVTFGLLILLVGARVNRAIFLILVKKTVDTIPPYVYTPSMQKTKLTLSIKDANVIKESKIKAIREGKDVSEVVERLLSQWVRDEVKL